MTGRERTLAAARATETTQRDQCGSELCGVGRVNYRDMLRARFVRLLLSGLANAPDLNVGCGGVLDVFSPPKMGLCPLTICSIVGIPAFRIQIAARSAGPRAVVPIRPACTRVARRHHHHRHHRGRRSRRRGRAFDSTASSDRARAPTETAPTRKERQQHTSRPGCTHDLRPYSISLARSRHSHTHTLFE